MHEVVAGEQENLLNSGVVSGGDAFREGVVGSGVGVPGGASAERTAAGMGFKHMVAASLVDELDDAEELEGSRDVYDAAEGGRAVRRKLASRKAAKAAERAGGQGAVPDPAGKAKSAADPCRQAAEMRAKSNGAAGATKASADAAAGASVEMSAQTVGTQVAGAGASAATAAAAAEGTAGTTGAIASAGIPVAGVVTGVVAFVLGPCWWDKLSQRSSGSGRARPTSRRWKACLHTSPTRWSRRPWTPRRGMGIPQAALSPRSSARAARATT